MELMQSVARKHNLVCLLHEKPFDGVNGSGKHNNWSLGTVEGENLLDPGAEPYKNHRFLLFLAAVIKAVDEYQDLLRISVASAGNDHRLGANEAPPAIVSMFLGTELTNVLKAVEAGVEYKPADEGELKLSGNVLPALKKTIRTETVLRRLHLPATSLSSAWLVLPPPLPGRTLF